MRRLVLSGIAALTAFTLAGCGQIGKPDREEVREGLVSVYLDSKSKPDQASAEFMADCMLDRVYDSAHDVTLRAWADGQEDQDEVSDNVVVFEASRACNDELADKRETEEKQAAGPMPSDAEIRSGLAKVLQGQSSSLTESEADAIAACVLDEVGDSVTDETLRALASGSNRMGVADASTIRTATQPCYDSAVAN
ncbi:LptM family lipoprotein [Gordonia terrae]|nr:hypothetical protein [Gordonia terrae]